MHMPHGYSYGYGSLWPMILIIVILAVLIILGVYLIMNYLKGGKSEDTDTPLQILQKRLAKGEIDEAEYERLKAKITKDKD